MKFHLAITGTLALVVLSGLVVLNLKQQEKPLEVLGQVEPFTLTDHKGLKVMQNDLNGKVWLAFPFFTSCPSICPAMNKAVQSLPSEILQNPKFRSVAISIDPKNDTPERLSWWRDQQGVGEETLTLSGVHDSRQALLKSLLIAHVEDPNQHGKVFILVDQNMKVRSYYKLDRMEDRKQMPKNISTLLNAL